MPGPQSPSHLDPQPDSGPSTDRSAFQNEPGRGNQFPAASYSSREGRRDEEVDGDRNDLAMPSLLPSLAHSEVSGMTAADAGNDGNIEEEERNGIEIAAAVLEQPQRVGEVPFYTGKLIWLGVMINASCLSFR